MQKEAAAAELGGLEEDAPEVLRLPSREIALGVARDLSRLLWPEHRRYRATLLESASAKNVARSSSSSCSSCSSASASSRASSSPPPPASSSSSSLEDVGAPLSLRDIRCDPLKCWAFFESHATSVRDLSAAHSLMSYFVSFAACLSRLGTSFHHQLVLSTSASPSAIEGCVALAEFGHGSNLRGIQTTARYEPSSGRFVLSSPPSPSAPCSSHKCWVANARTARWAIVFANLVLPVQEQRYNSDGRESPQCREEEHGIHAFLVPLRANDSSMQTSTITKGVHITAMGPKLGLNNVEHCQMWFDEVHIPRTHLLNRYVNVTREGEYVIGEYRQRRRANNSSNYYLRKASNRFRVHLGHLMEARIGDAVLALTASRLSLTIAIHYSLWRRQFGPGVTYQYSDNETFANNERPIMSYPPHQRRLIPQLANLFAFLFFLQNVKADHAHHITQNDAATNKDEHDDEQERRLEKERKLNLLAICVKAGATWHAQQATQSGRECCGGAGYLSDNLIAEARKDVDALVTIHGDNHLLLQLIAKELLLRYGQNFKPKRFFAEVVEQELQELFWIKSSTFLFPASSLLSPSYLLNLFFYREQKLLQKLGLRLNNRATRIPDITFAASSAKSSSRRNTNGRTWISWLSGKEEAWKNSQKVANFEVWCSCMNHATALGKAYMERKVMQQFYKVVERAKKERREKAGGSCRTETVQLLEKMWLLHALSTIEKDSAWFLSEGYLNASQLKPLRNAVDKLCSELSSSAGVLAVLVAALAVPHAEPTGIPDGDMIKSYDLHKSFL